MNSIKEPITLFHWRFLPMKIVLLFCFSVFAWIGVSSDPCLSAQAVARHQRGVGDVGLAGIVDPEDVDDPSKDGWDTEAFHLQAKSQLKKLGELFSEYTISTDAGRFDARRFDATRLKKLFSEAARSTEAACCSRLRPETMQSVIDQDGIVVESWRADTSTPATELKPASKLMSAAEAFQQLLAPYEGSAGVDSLRVEFKIFDVGSNHSNPTTTQYVSILGQTGEGLMELFATWNIEWEQPSKNKKPLIHSITLRSIHRSISRDSSRRLFSDFTQQVLGRNSSYAEQHRFGLNHWNSRIEATLNRDLMGHQGIAMGDIDGNRWEDIYVCQTGGLPNRLYRNVGDGTLLDVSRNSGVNFLDQTTAALFADFDNDGAQDLLVGMHHGTAIFANLGNRAWEGAKENQPLFEQKIFLKNAKHVYSPTAVDFDNDGDLDVYLCVYYPDGSNTQQFPFPYPFNNATNGGRNVFLRNDGDFNFTDVTEEVGLDEHNSRYSYSAGWEDFDGDGDLDLYVANDFGANNLFVNLGGRFKDMTNRFQAEDGNFGMSVSWGDYNRDGWPDIYISNMFSSAGNRIVPQAGFNPELDESTKENFLKLARGNTLLQNRDGKHFEDISVATGVNLGRWAWASVFADMNNDGWEDILVGNGYITGEDSGDL